MVLSIEGKAGLHTMEEKNQNTNEYTGEYGNPVERNDAAGQEPEKEQESSVQLFIQRPQAGGNKLRGLSCKR